MFIPKQPAMAIWPIAIALFSQLCGQIPCNGKCNTGKDLWYFLLHIFNWFAITFKYFVIFHKMWHTLLLLHNSTNFANFLSLQRADALLFRSLSLQIKWPHLINRPCVVGAGLQTLLWLINSVAISLTLKFLKNFHPPQHNVKCHYICFVLFQFIFFGQSGGVSQWRDCYHWGLV